ncbi:MAG: glycosyltransferase family 4 protein [Planctomycetes bacterium]|nr:glycosyltransferase family 4 protein [Planctomycetota bacterium]
MIRSVLQLSGNLNVYGVSHYMRTLGRGLIDRGIRVGVAAFGVGGTYDRDWFEREGFIVRQLSGGLPSYRRLWNPFALRDAFGVLRLINSIVDELQPDVVQANSGQMAGLYSLCNALRRNPVPLVSCIHGDSGEPEKLRVGRLVNRFFPRAYGSRSIAISSEMIDFLQQTIGISPGRIRLVRYAIDNTFCRPPTGEERRITREKIGLPPDSWVVCLIGQYVYRKGHDVLVDAAGLLKQRGYPIEILCAGEHHNQVQYKAELMARAVERGVADRMHLLGHSNPRDILWASDVGALPSRQEGFGLVVAEGMSCGVVQVRTPAAGARDTTIDGETGFIVPFDDPIALADKIGALITDPVLFQSMRERSITFARERFAADRMVDETLRVYEEAVT